MDRRISRQRWAILNDRRTREDRVPQQNRVFRTGKIAGVRITPDTAITLPAVWACLRYLSQTTAMLPWRVMLHTDRGEQEQKRSPIWYLIYSRPSDDYSSFQFRETFMHWALRWGNAYGEIERDIVGRAIAIHPIHPQRVQVFRDTETQEIYYEISNNYGGKATLQARDMFHIRGFGESVVGVNVMAYAADSIGWAKAAQLFGAGFFGNGATLSGLVKVKKRLNADGLAGIRKEFKELYGGPRNANKVAVLDNDMDYAQLGIEPEKGQFIETNQHLTEEVCRWFGVPPHKIFHMIHATFSNIEHQSIEVVTDSIQPWAKRFEDEADFKLFGARASNYTKMDLHELLRGDTTARMLRYRGLREVGALNANEIRTAEGFMGIGPDGDKYVMQGQYTTLEKIGELPAPGSTMPGGGGGAPEPDKSSDDPEPAPAKKPKPKNLNPVAASSVMTAIEGITVYDNHGESDNAEITEGAEAE